MRQLPGHHHIRDGRKKVKAKETTSSLRTISIAIALCLAGTASTAFGQTNQSQKATQTHEGTLMAAATPAEAPAAASAKGDAASIDAAFLEEELEELRSIVDQQSRQLDAQSEQLKQQKTQMEALQQQLKVAPTAASPAATTTSAAPAEAPAASTIAAVAIPAAPTAAPVAGPAVPAAAAPAAQGAEPKLGPIAAQNFRIGGTFYGNFSHYTAAGFSPAFRDVPTVQLPPGNSGLNVFEVTRAYVNLFYTPDQRVTLRITPDIYRSGDNSYAFRLKYGYVDFQKIFGDGAFKNDKITFGQTTQPLTDWEEGLSGYLYAYLTPWNYLGFSSTYSGAKIHGPIEMNGKEYLDYDLGVFNTANFHNLETNDKKDAMVRLTWYPFGTTADRTGFGLTFFENYGYNTKLPSQVSTPLNRLSALAHYQTLNKAYQIVFEYQLGRNAVGTGNIFSGTGAPGAGGPYDAFNSAAGSVLSGTHTRQQGFNFFGHARLGNSPFQVFGLFQYFQPNTNFVPSSIGRTDNPLDFERTVGGITYKVTNQFDVSFGDQNFHWRHPQGLAGAQDTNGVVIWTQYNF
jgi:TolA-binding protein